MSTKFKTLDEQISFQRSHHLNLIENYIYIYHLPNDNDTGFGKYVILPTYPESITDSMSPSFRQTEALSRSAPIFSYSNSGPRTININISLHREMFEEINWNKSNLPVEVGDDYVDTIIKCLQACAVPTYTEATKAVVPPKVAIRFGNEIFIKGVITSSISVNYRLPILSNNKYAMVSIGFSVSEIDPYDAPTVAQKGSFRGITRGNYWGTKEL